MKLSDRIDFRLIVICVSIITFLIVVMGSVAYFDVKTKLQSDFESKQQGVSTRVQTVLPAALWNFDKKQVEALITAEMGAPEISGIIVRDVKKVFQAGQVISEGGEVLALKADDAPKGILITTELKYDDAGKMVPAGFVEVYFSTAKIESILRDELIKIITAGVVLDLAIGFALLIGVNLVVLRSLNRVRLALETISSGDADLTQRLVVERHDEVGEVAHLFNLFVEQIQELIQQVNISTVAIADASKEIAAGNHDLSSRTEKQAGTLEETAASMHEFSNASKRNADNAQEANQMAIAASNIAGKGGEVVAQVVHTMSSINSSSKKIIDIISVIDGIAFQTNILALNAAVEAARAGEQGRGFAVVASEVRSLAQRSAVAAKEIKSLISESVEKVESGTTLVAQAGSTMNGIVDSINSVTAIMTKITTASKEQTEGASEISQAIGQMDNVTQQNAALVEQAAAAASSLEYQADKLFQMVGRFRVVQGASLIVR